ncbi:MAG: thiolase family protein [Planctomycetota bacterium]
MTLAKAFIPYGAWWSSPFCRWQGSLAGENSVQLAARATQAFLADRGIATETFDGLALGFTVPQKHSFYGAPWLAGMIGAGHVTGPTIMQACATGARVVATLAMEVETGAGACRLGVACDRTSNGPHLVYPDPRGIGGMGDTEEWVWDNFNRDPYAGNAMLQTAENVAKAHGITTEEQHEIVLLRHGQYDRALADDRAFQRRYMLPMQVGNPKKPTTVEQDEGVFPTTAEGLARLRPVVDGGTVTFGGQTHPADGNAGIVVCTEERARELSRDPAVRIQVLGFGSARVDKGHMPTAVVPAALAAMKAAGVGLGSVEGDQDHNPFAVNDAYHFCKTRPPERLNDYGSPLICTPRARPGCVLIELMEQLALEGRRLRLFSGLRRR